MDPLLTGMAEGNLGLLHRCDERCAGNLSSHCWGCFLVLPDLHACVGQSQKFHNHLVYTFNKSLVLISTITYPHIKGIIILVYKCFNDKK